MKILQVIDGAKVEIWEVPIPEPAPGEVRVKIQAVSICTQWDLHLRDNSPMFPGHNFHYPYTLGQPGHEGSGIVDALGDGVTTLQLGDRVSLWRDPGHSIPGCYAQYVVRPETEVIRVPNWLSPVATAPVELAMCVACAVLRMVQMEAIRGKIVAVSGLGPAGLIAVQMLKAEGATEIIGIDPVFSRRTKALELGATIVHTPEEALSAIPLRSTGLLDSAIDCVGAKKSVESLMDRVKDVLLLFGVQREDFTYSFRHWTGLRLCGCPEHHRGAAEYAVQLLERRKLDLESIISHQFPLENYSQAIDLLATQQATKVCLLPWQS